MRFTVSDCVNVNGTANKNADPSVPVPPPSVGYPNAFSHTAFGWAPLHVSFATSAHVVDVACWQPLLLAQVTSVAELEQ
jgi:hypothetical protein